MVVSFIYNQDSLVGNQSLPRSQNLRPKIDSSEYISPRNQSQTITFSQENPKVVLPNRERSSINSDWLTVIIFALILVFATIRYTYIKYIEHLFLSLFNYATSARMFQERSYPAFHAAYRLEGLFYFVFAVWVYQSLNALKWENAHQEPWYFLLILGFVLLYFFGKKLLYLMLGSLFQTQNETREYLFNVDNFNRSIGIVLLPIVILISYAPVENPVFIVLLGLTIVVIFNLVLLQRGLFILLKKQFSIFYLFLYLCSLEFLPLLLIYKIVVE